MPLPTPSKGESQDKFMGRCMAMVTEENKSKKPAEKRPQKQMVAMCFSQWRNGKSKASQEEGK